MSTQRRRSSSLQSQRTIHSISTCKSSPKYTFRGRYADSKKPTADHPGPGHYSGSIDSIKYENTPKYGFHGPARDPVRPSTAPGPGQYTPGTTSKNQPSHGFGTSIRKGSPDRSAEPGPGAYTSSPRIGEGPKFSAGARREPALSKDTPGPGAYTDVGHGSIKDAAPKFRFGSSGRHQVKNSSSPGPAQYTPSDPSQTSREYGFGTSGRKEANGPKIEPGPGSYNHTPRLGNDGPKFSAGGRRNSPRSSAPSSPGPGAYAGAETDAMKYNATPKFGFGGSPRDTVRDSAIPGPGQYSTNEPPISPSSSRYGFGSSKRKSYEPRTSAPGPGAYNHGTKIGTEGLKASMGSRREPSLSKDTPGPGSYQAEHATSAPSSPRFGFGSSIRHHKVGSLSPGPGAYQEGQGSMSARSYTMGSRRDVSHPAKHVPGPGTHEVYSQFA